MTTGGVRIISIRGGALLEDVRSLSREYNILLRKELGVPGRNKASTKLPGVYGPPGGFLLSAEWDRRAAGCVAVCRYQDGCCEMKNLYVRPRYHRCGVGRALTTQAIAAAREMGYRSLRLVTLGPMAKAVALYRSLGFREIAPYKSIPIKETLYMEPVL